jgi:hypothetical protein
MNPDAILSKSITDLRALLRYTIEVLELQQSEPELKTFAPADRSLSEIITTLREQIENIDRHLSFIPGSRTSLQNAASTMASAFLGFLTKTRSHDLMEILRDNATLLHHASMHYALLQTAANTLGQKAIFEVASANKREIDALVSDLSELAPQYLRRQLGQAVRAEQTARSVESRRLTTLVSDSPMGACT